MRSRGRLAATLAIAAVLVAVAIAVLLLAGRGPGPGTAARVTPRALIPTPTPEPVVVAKLRVSSPDIKLGVGKLYAVPERNGTWWEFVLVCQELKGCHGELELDLAYSAGGKAGLTTRRVTVDLPSLGQQKVRFIERPRHAVDAVEGVTVRLLKQNTPGAPRPRPIY